MSQRSLSTIFSLLLLVPAIAPLFFFDGLLYPYLAPKSLAIRGVGILALGAFLALALSGGQFYIDRLRYWASWVPGALLVFAYVSSAFGVDFYHSFWSLFDRGDGLLTLTALTGFFYFTLLRADKDFMNRTLRVISWVASFVAVFGILQWIQEGSGMNIPLIPEPHGRVSSTLGNAAFMASFLGLTVFVTLIVAPMLRGRMRTAAYTSAILQLVAILASATRGSLLALLGAAGLSLLYVAWQGSDEYRTRARAALAILVVCAGLFIVFRSQLANIPFSPVSRLASISLADATVESRLFIWKHITGEALKHPVLGVGAEHIDTVFNEIYNPTLIREEWFDRTHNAFLDYLVQYGIPGFLLFVLLLILFARESLHLACSASSEDAHMGKLFILLLFVYAAQNFFVFDTASTLWLFLVLFAFALAVRSDALPRALRPIMPRTAALSIGAACALLIIPVSFVPLRANMLLADGYAYHVFDIRRSVSSIEKGYVLGTYANLEYGYQLYEMYTERQMTMLGAEDRLLAYRLARNILAENYARYPYDGRTAVYYAHVLDVAPTEERPDEFLVREVLERAIQLSPLRLQPRYLLANIEIRKGDAALPGSAARRAGYDAGIQILREYTDMLPNLAEPRYIIATLYQSMNEPVVAADWAADGLTVYRPDANTARRAARYYINAEDWKNARRFLADVVSIAPADYPLTYDLAKAEFLAGNTERAKEIVGELREKAPGLVETDPAFLRAIDEVQ